MKDNMRFHERFSNIFQMQYGGGLTKKRNTKTIEWRLTFFLQHKTNFEQSVMTKSSFSKNNFDLFKSTCLSERRDNVNYWIQDFFWTSFRVLIYLCSNSLLIRVASLVSTVAYWTHVYQWSIICIFRTRRGNILLWDTLLRCFLLKDMINFSHFSRYFSKSFDDRNTLNIK